MNLRFSYILTLLLCWLSLGLSFAGDREQAQRIHDRLTGIPPSATVLNQMEALISGGDAVGAANLALINPSFYNVTLKNWIAPWSNLDQDRFVSLNDYTATVIGIIRDERDFRTVLYDDVLYTAANTANVPAYANTDNDHYVYLDENDLDLSSVLVAGSQSSITGLPSDATAGVMTSRAAAQAFFIDGTNRAMFRFSLMNYLCRDLEQLKDPTRPPDRIRQDVSRSPGGDSRLFLNNCVSCHSGMDPMAQAFAYYEFQYDSDLDPNGDNGQLVYNTDGMIDPDTGSRVQRKYRINSSNFSPGFITPDDQWQNYWRSGPNRGLGWDGTLSGDGYGAKSMGQELAHSELFAQCQVEKVFQAVCLREPVDATDRTQITSMISQFKASTYNLKTVFAASAAYCRGD